MKLKEMQYDKLNTRKEALDAAKVILAQEGKTEAYTAKMAEVERLNEEIEAIKVLIAEEEKGEMPPETGTVKALGLGGVPQASGYEAAVKAFAAAARLNFRVDKAAAGTPASEGVGADGGYTVPADIVTRILQLRDAEESLLDEVTVIPVTTKSGSRTRKKRSQHTGFQTVAEAAKVGTVATPEYEQVQYTIEKRSGVLPVTAELYEDSDANITQEAENWLSAEARVTANKEILAVIATLSQVDLKNLDGILKAWIGLGSAFRTVSKLVTNDDGLLWLGTLKDANGRYLLTPNPAEPQKLQLCVGPYTIPVKTYDNATIPSSGTKIPLYIGSMKDAVWYWDRQQISIKLSDVAVVGNLNAFENDLILWKGTIRDDCTKFDEAALVNGYIDTAASVAAG